MSKLDMEAIKGRAHWCANDGINVAYRTVARPDDDRPPFGFRTASASDEDAYLDRIELIDEIDRLTTWRPIADAPKDGTEILGWCENGIGVRVLRWRGGKWHLAGIAENDFYKPTHWQPRPAGPTS